MAKSDVDLSPAEQTRRFLDVLLAGDTEGRFANIWSIHADETKLSSYADAADIARLADLVAEHEAHPAARATYIGTAVAKGPRGRHERFRNQDISGLVALFADIDIAGDAHADGRKTYPTTIEDALRVAHGVRDGDGRVLVPTMIVHSGHGIQCWWVLVEPMLDTDRGATPESHRAAMAALVRDWVTTVRVRARQLGLWDVDSTTDLARVLRVPGTANRKIDGDHRPVRLLNVTLDATGHPVTYEVDELRAGLASRRETDEITTGSTVAVGGADLRAVAGQVDLAACWRESNSLRGNGFTPRWMANIADIAADDPMLADMAEKLLAAWNGTNGLDDSENDLSLASSWRHLHGHRDDPAKVMHQAAVMIMCSRMRSGRKIEKIDPSRRVDYVARTLALAFKPNEHRAAPMTLGELEKDADMASSVASVPLVMLAPTSTFEAPAEPDVPDDAPPTVPVAPQVAEPDNVIDYVKSRRWGYDHESNAVRFVATFGSDTVAFVPGVNLARTWRGDVWITDTGTHLHALVTRLTELMRAQAARELAAANKLLDDAGDDPAKQAEGKVAIKRSVEFDRWTTKSRMGSDISHTVKAIKALPGVEVSAGKWDRDDRALNCLNGTVRVDFDGVITFDEHRAADRITHQIGTAYDPQATCPRWDAFIGWALPAPGVRRVFQQLAGLSLLGGNRRHLFSFAIGRSRSGKTTAVEVIGRVLGNTEEPTLGLASSFKMTALRGKRESGGDPQLFRLLDRRFVFGSEAADGWALTADVVKSFSGGDTQSVRDNYAKAHEVVDRAPKFSPWIVSNAPPEITGADDALFERVRAVPFDQHRAEGERDPELVDRIAAAESSGVLNWLLAGLVDAIQHPEVLERPNLPAACTALANRMREDADIYARFVAECCEPCPCAGEGCQECVGVDRSWSEFRAWSLDAGEKPGTKRQLGNALSEKYPARPKKLGGATVRLRFGLRLSDALVLKRQAEKALDDADDERAAALLAARSQIE